MKKIFILIAIASMTFCACNKSEIIENKEAASFVASFDANTKTTLNDDRSQSWLGGEIVKVLDVTDASQDTPVETTCTFTNIGPKGPKATFVADDPEFEFVEGHNYFVYYGGTLNSTNYSTTLSKVEKALLLGLKFSTAYLYNPTGTYGLSDNQIPLASKFKYTGKASVQNIIFHNISSLLVLRVKNNSAESKQVGYIQIEQSKQEWQTHMFGGALVPFSKTDDYSNPSTSYDFGGGSNATYLAIVSFSSSTTIEPGETKDFAVCVLKPYNNALSFDLTAQIYDKKPGTIVASAVKSGLSKTNFDGPGHTYVWSINITSSKATNALNINPLGNNELAF